MSQKPRIEVMQAGDKLTTDELAELAELQHCTQYYISNMTQSAIARLNLLSVMAQRDQLFDRLKERETKQASYSTVQMSANAPGGMDLIHLAGPGIHGGTGAILCGIDRHARDPETGEGLYGFSVGGGWSSRTAEPCPTCLEKATPRFSGSMFAHLFAPVGAS